MNKILLSIIINSYNEEKYIKKCLNSVLNQNSKYFEIIIIDDDSSDRSQKIIEKEIAQIKNVSFFKIKHSGISKARNFAINKAKGKYIMFIDGDDFLIKGSLNKIVKYLKTQIFDVAFFNVVKYYDEKGIYEKEILSIKDCNNVTEKNLIQNKIFARPWRFIYKKEMLQNYNIVFPNNLVCEDEEWVSKIVYYANNIKYLDEYVYVYRKRKGSITSNKDIDYLMDLSKIIQRTYFWSFKCKDKKKYINFSLSRCIRNLLDGLNHSNNPKEKQFISSWYKKNYKMIMKILNYNKKLKILILLFGNKNGIKIYKRFFREKYKVKKIRVSSIDLL